MHPRDAFHACHECRRFAPAARPSVKRLLFAVFPAVRKNVRCPNLLSLLLLIFSPSFRDVSVNLPAPCPPFWWAVPFQARETCLQNMDFSCCSARGGIEPPLLAERRFTSRGCSPELRTMRKGLALAVFLLFLVFGRVLRRVMCCSCVRYVYDAIR